MIFFFDDHNVVDFKKTGFEPYLINIDLSNRNERR